MSHTIPGPVLITGANGGLGCALAEGFLAAGFTALVCQYRSGSERIAALLAAHRLDPQAHLFRAELTSEEEVEGLQKAVEARFGPLWGLVNLAGGASNAMSWKMSLADFRKVVDMNLTSTFLATRAFLPAMRNRGGGRIVNVASIVAHSGVPGASHYCAAKAGVEGFTRAVALETASRGVTVNALALGYFDRGIVAEVPTEMLEAIMARIPAKRLGSAGEIYPLVAYLLSEEAAFMTGQVLHLNGGHYL